MKIIESVTKQSVIRESGPVTITGSIEDDAQIEIKEGSLLVSGTVGKNVKIKCTEERVASTSTYSSFSGSHGGGQVIINGLRVSGASPEKSGFVKLEGNVDDNVKVTCAGNFNCRGNIADSFTLKVNNGDATFEDIGKDANVTTCNGNVTAGVVGQNSTLRTLNGDVRVRTAHETANVKTANGEAYVNGKRVEQSASRRSNANINSVITSSGRAHGSNVQINCMIVNSHIGRSIVTTGNVTITNDTITVDEDDISDLTKQFKGLNPNI